METLRQDVNFAFRMLRKNKKFTALAVLSAAVGIAVSTAVFSFVNAAFLRPLPVQDPGSLCRIYTTGINPLSYPYYQYIRQQSDAFSGVLAYSWVSLNLGSNEQAERVEGALVSGNYFDLLGLKAAVGRTFLPEEDITPDANPVVVLSHDLWQRHFSSASDIIGKTITLNGRAFTIVGIAPAGFKGTDDAFPRDVWVPMMMYKSVLPSTSREPVSNVLEDRTNQWLFVIARLKSGVGFAQALAKLNLVATQWEQAYPEVVAANINSQLELYPAGNGLPQMRTALLPVAWLLLAAVGLVILIACANIANLLLARSVTRRKEVALRLALGASRARLITQFLTESLLLALLGGVLGLLFSFALTRWLLSLKPTVPLPVNVNFSLDWRVFTFALLLSILCGILFGLAPALRLSKPDLASTLKETTTSFSPLRSRLNLISLLVISQVSISALVLVGAGLFIKSLYYAQRIETGFTTDHDLLLMTIDTGSQNYDANKSSLFYQQLMPRIQSLPGVISVSGAQYAPLSFLYAPALAAPVTIEGQEPPPDSPPTIIGSNTVWPGYFETLGIPIVHGRAFSEQDRAGTPGVVVVNEAMVRKYFPNTEPLGHRLRLMRPGGQVLSFEIVGVAKDVKTYSLGEESSPYMYLNFLQKHSPVMTLSVRTNSGDPKSLVAAVRQQVHSLDSNLPIYNVTTLNDNIRLSLLPARLGALLLGGFGFLALALACLGIYGVLNYQVAQSKREIGIRMALGSGGRDVLKLVLIPGTKMVLIGIAIGLFGAYVATRVLNSLLYGVSTTDRYVFAAVPFVLVFMALLTCYVPARRAMKVDPLLVLREE